LAIGRTTVPTATESGRCARAAGALTHASVAKARMEAVQLERRMSSNFR
jgi:hypothetical protein